MFILLLLISYNLPSRHNELTFICALPVTIRQNENQRIWGRKNTNCPVLGYISLMNIEYISRMREKCCFWPCESLRKGRRCIDLLYTETYLAPRQIAYLPKLMKSVSVWRAEIRGARNPWSSSRDWAKRIWRGREKGNNADRSYSETIWCRLLR